MKFIQYVHIKYQRSTLVFKLMLIVATCLTVTIIFIETLYIQTARSFLINTTFESEQNILREVNQTSESLTTSMTNLSTLLYNNVDFIRLSSAKNISSYSDLYACSKMADQLLYANTYFRSIAIYLPNCNRTITTDYGVYSDATDYFDDELFAFYKDSSQSVQILEKRAMPSNIQGDSHAYTIFIKLYTNGSNLSVCTGVLAINADYEEAFNNITISTKLHKGKEIHVFSDNKHIFSNPQNRTISIEQLGLSKITGSGYRFSNTKTGDYFVTYCSINNKVFISMLPASYITSSIWKMNLITLLSGIGIFIFCIGISIYFSKMAVRPIEKAMLHALPQNSGDTHKNGDVASLILKMTATNRQLNEKLYQSFPILREDFLRSLTQKASDGQDLTAMMELLQIQLCPDKLNLLLIDLDDTISGENAIGEAFFNQSLIMLIETQLNTLGCHNVSYSYDATTIISVIDTSSSSPDRLFDVLDKLHEHLKNTLQTAASFILCENVENIYTIYRSFQRCLSMRKYKKLYRKGAVLTCRTDTEISDSYLSSYPVECENKLINAIRNGDINESITQLDSLMAEIFKVQSLLFLQNFFYNLINSLSALLSESGKNLHNVFNLDYLNHIINESGSFDEFKEYLINLVETVIDGLQCNETDKHQAHYQSILEYIHQNYARDISFSDISKTLGISKNYINIIIRSCVDTTFVQLLTSIRLQQACNYLKQSDLTINEIAAAVGFSSSKYFIQVFKKHYGITPGQYR